MRNIKDIESGSNRTKNVEIFKETMEICRVGGYKIGDEWVNIGEHLKNAMQSTELYSPNFFAEELADLDIYRSDEGEMKIEVTMECTVEAGMRLSDCDVVALNFASGVSVGGGVLMGAVAQEEDLCRSSGLYNCLDQQYIGKYYEKNRLSLDFFRSQKDKDGVYTDYIIYSGQVPFFRDGKGKLLTEPFLMSIITSPAPCVRSMGLESDLEKKEYVMARFFIRAWNVLSLSAYEGHRNIILGAWGCGAFGNCADDVAKMFRGILKNEYFDGIFDRVVFAIYAKDEEDINYKAFKECFSNDI